jgi:trans-L-3-hydroxyproline dehydratase
MAIKQTVMNTLPLKHPEEKELGFLYGTIFTGPAKSESAHSRHVCVFADGAIDRSPTGTGVSARMALLFARDQGIREKCLLFESITGEFFSGKIASVVNHHGMPAIVPEVGGAASFTGRHTFLIEPGDALANGFLVR